MKGLSQNNPQIEKMSEIKHKVVVVFPAYFAEKTLELTVNEVPKGVVDQMILVDDHSSDGTVQLAKKN